MVCRENSNIWWIALGYSILFDVSSSSLTREYPKGVQRVFVMGFYMQMCDSLTLICVDRDRLFGSEPNSLHDMETTYFVVAEGVLSCAFTHASSWERGCHDVVLNFWQFFRSCMCATPKYLDHKQWVDIKFPVIITWKRKNVAGKSPV